MTGVSSRSDSPTVPATAATQDTKMASTEEMAEGPAVSDSPSPEDKADQHDDEPTTSNDRIPDDDQHVSTSRDSEHVEDSSDNDDNDDDEDDGKASSSDESPTSVADGIPEGDSNADLHALLAFSKKRLDTAKPVPDESQPDTTTKANDEEEDDEDDAQNKAEEKQQEEKKEDAEEVDDGDETKETNDVAAAAEKMAQDVPDETVAAADDNDGSNADTADASKAKADDDATAAAKMDGMSSKEAAAKASQADEDSNKELWALLSYSKQRLETGAHAGQQKDKKKSGSSRKKRSSSIGTSGSMKSPLTSPTASPARRPRKSDAAADTDMEELRLDGGDNTTGNVEDDDGQHSRESVASETLRAEDADKFEGERLDDDDDEEYSNDEEELSSDEEGSEVGSSDEEEESDDDSTGGIPATPAFLRQLEETDKEDPDSTDAKLMSDAARSYADAILSVADEKTTGDLTDEQMLEAMCVAEAAAAAGKERFTTSIAKLRLHEAKEASKKMAASMKAEVEKASKTAKAAKDRQVARQNKIFSGKRPAGQWIKGKMKEFQETCAKVDGGQP